MDVIGNWKKYARNASAVRHAFGSLVILRSAVDFLYVVVCMIAYHPYTATFVKSRLNMAICNFCKPQIAVLDLLRCPIEVQVDTQF